MRLIHANAVDRLDDTKIEIVQDLTSLDCDVHIFLHVSNESVEQAI